MCIRVRALRGLRFLIVTTSLSLTAGGAVSDSTPSSPLTLEEAGHLALAEQPQIVAQQALTLAAQETAIAERQLPDPQLMLAIEDVPVNGPDALSLTRDEMTQIMIGFAQDFPRARSRDLRSKKAFLEGEAAAEGVDDVRRQVRRAAGLAWLEVFEGQRALVITREIHAQSLRFAEAAEIAYRAGRSSQAEVLAARIDAEQVADTSAMLGLDVHHARTALERWIGAAAERPAAAELPAMPPPPELEDLLAAVERHPQIRLLAHRVEAAQAEISLGQDEYRPGWSLEVYYANRPEFSDMIGARVNVGLPLFTANRQDRRLAARQALRDESLAQREDALRSLRAEAIESQRQWREQSARVTRYDEIILPAARQRVAAAEAAYAAAQTPVLTMLEARRALLDAELKRLELAVDAARGAVRCQFFTASEAA